MPTIRRWGKPGKAGKSAGPVDVQGQPHGPRSGDNTMPAAPFRYGSDPNARRTAAALFVATSLTSPMVRGRFRPQDNSNGTHRSTATSSWGTPDLGALQHFVGLVGSPRTARLGAQAGPSSQPAFPNTNNDSSVDLSGLDLPDVWRVNRL